MKHLTTPEFREAYKALPEGVRKSADKAFALLKDNPRHPSLQFKPVGRFWSVRASHEYRALAVNADDTLVWFGPAITTPTTALFAER